MAADRFANNASTTTTADPGSGGTTLAVTSATGFPSTAQFRIRVEDAPAGSGTNMELMTVTAGAGTASWTVTRGVESTTAVAHATGSAVTQIVTAGALETISLEDDFKQSVRVASAANVTISGPGTAIDGVTLSSGDRVFLKDQTTAADNGIYVFNGSASAMTRANDADTAAKMADTAIVKVGQGTANADTVWQLITDNPITLGTTALTFTRVSPPYIENGNRNPWAPTGTVCQNLDRSRIASSVSTGTSALWVYYGGGVLPAGRTITNVNVFWGTAGATYTVRHFSLVRASDFVVLQRTANSTATPTANAVLTAALQATYTAPVDTPIYVVMGVTAGTAGTIFGTAGTQYVNGLAPAIAFTATTGAPTSTPPAVGATVPSTGTASSTHFGYYLT